MERNNVRDKKLYQLLNIDSQKDFKEYNIVVLMDKKKTDSLYKDVEFYGETLKFDSEISNDFACVIIPSEQKSKSEKSFMKLTSNMYIKRYSGLLNVLKIFFEYNETFAKTNTTKTALDNKSYYAKFNSGGIDINIILHNENNDHFDNHVIQTLNQLIYIAQIKSEQLVTIQMQAYGLAKLSNKQEITSTDVLKMIESKFNESKFLDASYDMINSKEYCFNFKEKDFNLPVEYEKHLMITGFITDMDIFTKLNYYAKKICEHKGPNK